MKIAILGAGKMGAWMARQLSEKHEVAVYDVDRFKAGGIPNVKPLGKPGEIGEFAPELLVNAVNLDKTVEAFEGVLPHLSADCILCDLASVKGSLPHFYKKSGHRFVSVHPMFGPTFADMDSLREENAVIIRESDSSGAALFREFFSSFGLHVFEYTFAEHDEMMAYSLTTPFIASLVFASCLGTTVVPGATFAKHMKIARGLLSEDEWLICEILFNQHSIKQIEKMTAKLEFLKHIIMAKDHTEAREFLAKLRKNVER